MRMPGDAPLPDGDGRAAEGLYFVSMAAALALGGAYFLPPLLLIAPGPLAALVYRRGYRAGILAGLALALGVFWLQSVSFAGAPGLVPPHVLRLFQVGMFGALLTVGLVGLSIGGSWREGGTPAAAVLMGAGAFVLPPLLAYAAAAIGWKVNLLDVAYSVWGAMQDEIARQRALGAFDPQVLDQMSEWVQAAELSSRALRPVLPAFCATAGLVGSLGSGALARRMLRRHTPRPEPLPPFQLWRFPWYVVFGFLLGQGTVLLNSLGVSLGVWEAVGRNLHLFFSNVYLVQGLAIIYYFLTRRPVPAPVRVAVLAVAGIWLSLFVVWLGALDVWLNFRRLPLGVREGDDER